ncbi:MAG: hypothetical protein WBD25_08860 [Terriglobales bacterium]|jgi:hypothetical protein
MRPYLVLAVVVLMAAATFGQQRFPYPGSCLYGCGPYIPLVTTPQISLQQASPNPVGASNATTGLIAGATNSTLSEIQGSTSSVYTVPVWYQGGGAPLITPDVHLYPETIGREGRPMHAAMGGEESSREERGPRGSEQARASWTSFGGHEHTIVLGNVAKGTKGDHVYTNDDIMRQNNKNGDVKYDGKAEKI